jgi:DNA-binding transcriptional LysR family regulator
VEEGIDVAVRIGHLPDSALVATQVGTLRRVVVGSPGYLSRNGKPTSPTSLASHRCVSFSGVTPSESWAFGARRPGERGQQIKVRPVLTVNAAEAAVAAVAAGAGLGCFLSYQVTEALRAGSVARVLTRFEPPPLPVHLVYPGMSGATAKVRAFAELAAPLLRAALARVERAVA